MKGVSRVLFIFALIVGVLFSNKTAISIGTNAHMKDVVLDDVLTQIKLTSQKKERKQDSIIDNIGIIETPESTIRDWETIQSFRELENDRSGPSYTIPEISDPSNSSTFDPDIVNVSPGKFVYEKFSYNNIQKGDIIFETHVSDALNYIGHIAFVYDVAKPFSDGTNSGTFIETIEAVPSSVRFGWLDDNRMKTQGVVILRPVYANSTNINQASYFVYGQLGKPYNFPYDSGRVNTSYYSANWYCSELVYAVYYYAGVNLHSVTTNNYCLPRHLYETSYTYTKNFSQTLDIEYVEKTSGNWKIKVRNTNSFSMSFKYNKKNVL